MSRRHWLAAAMKVGLGSKSSVFFASSDEGVVVPGKRQLILHNDYPEDLETPIRYFNTWQTPNDAFFVRQHLPVPQMNPKSWRLVINGRVGQTTSFSLAELKQMQQHRVVGTLECAGNGRGNFEPKVPGIQWKAGAVGNAEWRGVRLADILDRCRYDKHAAYVNFDGADAGVASTPDFIRALPMRKVLDASTLVALEMNGVALPKLHGGPARLIVPGWDGASWVKWLVRVSVEDQPSEGFFMKSAYRFPKHNVIPGGTARPEDLEVIEGMPVKSLITSPEDQAKSPFGPLTISGVAWAGEEKIDRVEVSTDGGALWVPAEVISPSLKYAWVLWNHLWKPSKPGYHTVLSRAHDSAGRVQPIVPVWNPSGYLWNAVAKIGIHLEV